MSVELQVIGVLVSVVATVVGGYYALAAVVVRQFKLALDDRFKAQDKARQEGRRIHEDRIGALEREHRALHTKLLEHLADLPREYVRREDHIRFETVISAKLDALDAQIRLIAERQQVRA